MGWSSTVVAACTDLASAQYGCITMDQALQVGLSADGIQRLVGVGAWRRLHTGVYLLWSPRDAKERWLQGLMAGVLWLGSGSAVSHRSAAALWRLDGAGSQILEFTTSSRRRSRDAMMTIHHFAPLRSDELQILRGFPVTSAARTLTDLAWVVSANSLELALESALRRELTTRGMVEEWLKRSRPSHPGKGALRAMLARLPKRRTESPLETLLWQLAREDELPEPIRQYIIRDQRGFFVARPDFAYPDARIAIEADGWEEHSKRRAWVRDRRRLNALGRLGWIVYHTTWEDVMRRPRTVAREIIGLFADRSTAVGHREVDPVSALSAEAGSKLMLTGDRNGGRS